MSWNFILNLSEPTQVPSPIAASCSLCESEHDSHSVISNSLWAMDYNLPGSSVHGILQERILECVAIPFSRGSPQPRDQTQVSCTTVSLSVAYF